MLPQFSKSLTLQIHKITDLYLFLAVLANSWNEYPYIYIYNCIVSNDKLTSYQSGFIKGDSTVNQLTYIYNDICKALDEGKEVRAVFCDISKAFDRVWHRGLLYKLSSAGIHGPLLNWFSSYLSQRRQRVVYCNSSSSWSSVNAGGSTRLYTGSASLFDIY